MRCFSKIIEDLNLWDLLVGMPFTWCGGQSSRYTLRLDRLLVLEEWENNFFCLIQRVLRRSISDHSPIILDRGVVQRC